MLFRNSNLIDTTKRLKLMKSNTQESDMKKKRYSRGTLARFDSVRE